MSPRCEYLLSPEQILTSTNSGGRTTYLFPITISSLQSPSLPVPCCAKTMFARGETDSVELILTFCHQKGLLFSVQVKKVLIVCRLKVFSRVELVDDLPRLEIAVRIILPSVICFMTNTSFVCSFYMPLHIQQFY